MSIFDFFKSKKPKNLLEEFESTALPLVVHGYREIAKRGNIAPTSKTSDQEIINIYQKVGSAFFEAAKKRNERIPALYLNGIALKFIQIHEMSEEFFYEHLKYEINNYLANGLRDDYKRELKLF